MQFSKIFLLSQGKNGNMCHDVNFKPLSYVKVAGEAGALGLKGGD